MRLSDFLARPYRPLSDERAGCATLTANAVARRSRTPLLVAALVSALVLGAGLGAAAFAVLDDGSMIVRQVTVEGSQPVAESDLPAAQIYERAAKSVVELAVSGGSGGSGAASAQGSGFVYDESGHIVTNQHVVAGATSIAVSFWNGVEVDAKHVGTDPSTDLAVLRVDGSKSLLRPLRLGDSSVVVVGDPVLAFGSPFGLEGTVTAGIVSALHREMTAPNNYTITNTIQTDAAINHGNSGGPLLDRRGRVIGVNAQIESESGGSDGVGFAIPSTTVRSIVGQLIATGEVEHAYLGIRMAQLPDGVAVTEVLPGTPAEKAGLHPATGTTIIEGQEQPSGGDVVVEFDGEKVTSSVALQSAVDARRPGDTVSITVVRNGSRRTLAVTLGVRP